MVKGTKICFKCGIEKNIDEFGKYKNRDGTQNVCKVCFSLKTHKKQGQLVKRVKEEDKGEFNDMFNNEQLKKIESLVTKHNEIIEMLNNKINLWEIDDIKADRVQKTIKINTELDKIISEKAKQSRLSYSDIINIVVKKGLEFVE